jgi:hypothetical protein
MRLVAKDDVSFGIAQISMVLAGVALRVLRDRRAATWVVLTVVGTIAVGCNIAEFNGGHTFRGASMLILIVLAALVVVIVRARKLGRRADVQV